MSQVPNIEEEVEGEMDDDLNKKIEIIELNNKDPRWSKPIMAGWMQKFSKTVFKKTFWVKRFFILNMDGTLWYFANEKAKQKPKKNRAVEVKGMKFWKSSAKRHCIQIERYSKPFYFYGNDMNSMLKWIVKLGQAGGIYEADRMVDRMAPEISVKSVKEWKADNVIDWLDYFPLSRQETFAIYEENFKNIDGKKLLLLQDKKLHEMGIENRSHRMSIAQAIRYIKRKKKFDLDFHVVLKKILRMLDGKCGRVRIAQQYQVAMNLSKPKEMCKSYLSMEQVEQFQEGFEAEAVEEDEEEKKRAELDDGAESTTFMQITTGTPEQIAENAKAQKINATQYVNVFPVKLVITEISRSNKYKTARKLLSPIMAQFPKLSQEFGIFHTALIIGPWYLEWNNSSLVVPRQLSSSMALLSADIDDLGLLEGVKLEEIVKKIGQVVCLWNTRKSYDNMNMKNVPHLGNCQQFVEDLMAALGVTFDKEGALGKFLEGMKKNGKCSTEFSPNELFKKTYEISTSVVKFDSHLDLDQFVLSLQDKDVIALRTDFIQEMKLLKSFDRAFWLRHFKMPENPQYKPVDGGKCPFKDPRLTKSYMVPAGNSARNQKKGKGKGKK